MSEMHDRCWGGGPSMVHLWQVFATRTNWTGNSTTPVPQHAPTEIVYQCAYCGSQRMKFITSTGPRP